MCDDCNIYIELRYSAVKAVTELSPSQVVRNISNNAKNSEVTASSFANYKAVFYINSIGKGKNGKAKP